MKHLGEQCSCINYRAKQAIEWALDYHIIDIAREVREAEILAEKAKQEFMEITGKEPEYYKIEGKIQRLRREHDFYVELRDEIRKLPQCPEPFAKVIEHLPLAEGHVRS